ncbi:hypothetical protein NQL31_003725 [Lotmaria passim]
MGRRQNRAEKEQHKAQPRRRRLLAGFCVSRSNDVFSHASSTAPTRPSDGVEAPPSSNTMRTTPPVEKDLIVPYPNELSSSAHGIQPATVAPATTEETPESTNTGAFWWVRTSLQREPQHHPSHEEPRSSACPPVPASEVDSASRRLSRQTLPASCLPLRQLPQPLQQRDEELQRQCQLPSPSAASSRAISSFPPLVGLNNDYAHQQAESQLRALPVPDSRLLVFNTQMKSPVPMLVHGISQHNFISISSAQGSAVSTGLQEHFASPNCVPPLKSPTQPITGQAAKTTTDVVAVTPTLPAYRRSRPTALVISEPIVSPFARVPPAAPAPQLSSFLAGGGSNANVEQWDGQATALPALNTDSTVSPRSWSSMDTPHDFGGSGASACTVGSSNLLCHVPTLPHSHTESAHSVASNSLHSSSLMSSSSTTSSFGQGPMNGGTNPVPLQEQGFATWQNSSTTKVPLNVPATSQPASDVLTNPVGTSILMPRRNSSHSSAEMTLGSLSFISARLRKGSREAEVSKEVEMVADLVARMQAAKRKTERPQSAELTDTRAVRMCSSGGSGGTTSRVVSAKVDGAGPAGVVVSMPPPPPLRISGDSAGLARTPRPHNTPDVPLDTPLLASTPEPLQPLAPPTTPPSANSPLSTSLRERDATSTSSGRSSSSYRRRDVKASVEAALASMSSSSAPAPSAASRRKRRDMAVNFLFSP